MVTEAGTISFVYHPRQRQQCCCRYQSTAFLAGSIPTSGVLGLLQHQGGGSRIAKSSCPTIVVEFAAKWNGRCRKESPTMVGCRVWVASTARQLSTPGHLYLELAAPPAILLFWRMPPDPT